MRTANTALAAIALSAVLAGCGGASETGAQVGAYRSCERAVEASLKAPSTADFSGYSKSQISSSGDNYSVVGYVDAQNSFGGTVRSNWTCEVRNTGDNWALVDLNVS